MSTVVTILYILGKVLFYIMSPVMLIAIISITVMNLLYPDRVYNFYKQNIVSKKENLNVLDKVMVNISYKALRIVGACGMLFLSLILVAFYLFRESVNYFYFLETIGLLFLNALCMLASKFPQYFLDRYKDTNII